jgi:hypothetical protein
MNPGTQAPQRSQHKNANMPTPTERTLEVLAERIAVLERAFTDYKDHHIVVHDLLAQLITARATDIQRRLEAMNELRAQIDNERGRYVTRELYDTKTDDINERINLQEQFASNIQGRMLVAGAVILAITGFLVKFLK